jgi:hypothetical protein
MNHPINHTGALLRYGVSALTGCYVAVCSRCGVLAVDAQSRAPIQTAVRAHVRRYNVATRLALVPAGFGLSSEDALLNPSVTTKDAAKREHIINNLVQDGHATIGGRVFRWLDDEGHIECESCETGKYLVASTYRAWRELAVSWANQHTCRVPQNAAALAASCAEYEEQEQAAAAWEADHPVAGYSEYDAETFDEMGREAHLMPDLSAVDDAPAVGPFVEADGWDAYRATSFAALGYQGSRLA